MDYHRSSLTILVPPLLLLCFGLVATAQTGDVTIESLHIRSNVRHRFSETLVTSRVSNPADIAQDVTFDVRLPNEAFISGYSMLIDGVVYPGRVEEKAAADRRFDEAVSRGESAGKVSTTSARETNEFVITVNVAAESEVTFNLTYHELLQRRLGLYEHVIHVNPGQVVPDLRIQVAINESREITELTVPEVRGDRLSSQVITGGNKFARINSISPNSVEVTFAPTPEQQREYTARGVEGQFIVNYEVDRTADTDGEILISNGYFVHFFAPENLPPMGKRIVFVLDTSGSMGGRKIAQLREALIFILEELRPLDEFAILLFSGDVREWDPEGMIPATAENVERAKTFARSIGASGGTNINEALLHGLRLLSFHITKPSMLLFLTDGQATVGQTTSARILENVRRARHDRQTIYSLAFGSGADFDLLKKLSAQNKGFARKIFEDADSALQLAGFYNEISSPLLSEVQISYISDFLNDTSLTRSSFTTFFSGSEIVVAGRYNDSGDAPTKLSVVVEGNRASSYAFQRRRYCVRPWWVCASPRKACPPQGCPAPVGYCPTPYWYHPPIWPCPPPPPPPSPIPPIVSRPTSFIERLWVYLTIKQLVEKTLEEDNSSSSVTKGANSEALRLSLKYNFVTPYTAMVATKPKHLKAETSFGPSAQISNNVPNSFPSLRRSFVQPSASKNAGFLSRPIARGSGIHPSGGVNGQRFLPMMTAFPRVTTTIAPPAPVVPGFPSGLDVAVNMTTPEGQGGALCLDIVTPSPPTGSSLLLLNDTDNDLTVTGTFLPKLHDGYRKFESVSLTVNGSDVLVVSVKSVSVRGRRYRWWQLTSLSEDDVTVSDGRTVELRISGNTSLVFHKYGIETRRSLSSPFIRLSVNQTETLAPESTGVIGAVLGLTDIRVSLDGRLRYLKDGVEKEAAISEDKRTDGSKCYRVSDSSDLREIVGP